VVGQRPQRVVDAGVAETVHLLVGEKWSKGQNYLQLPQSILTLFSI
jgi:hypothetical protein